MKYAAPEIDTQRIVALPVVEYDGDALAAKWTRALRLPGGRIRLNTLQGAACEAMATCGGLAGPIGVGHGKTFIVLLAGVVLRRKHNIVITKAPNVNGLRDAFYNQIKPNFRTPDTDPVIISFDDLSTPRGKNRPALLDELTAGWDPKDISIAVDEAHCLKDMGSSRAFRFATFVVENPDVAVVVVSGTLIGKRLKQAAHLFELALRERSPLPIDDTHLASWGNVLDDDGKPGPLDWDRVAPLWHWAGHQTHIRAAQGAVRLQAIRMAFQRRYRHSAGVVASKEGSIGTSLNLHGIDVPVPIDVQAALTALSDADEGPDGEPIVDDVERWRLARYISAGFYYVIDWPDPDNPDTDYLNRRRAWKRMCRRELLFHRQKGYDSEALVAAQLREDIAQGRRRRPIHDALEDWLEALPRWGTAGPPLKAVWLDYYLVDHAVVWAKTSQEPCIVWYESLAVEAALRQCGMVVYGRGTVPPEYPAKPHTAAMSIEVQGTGKNLQNYARQYLLEIPPNAEIMEQLLGRLHRQLQEAGEVDTYLPQHTDAYCDALAKCRAQARAMQDTSGNEQKLNYCTFVGIR